MRTDEQPREQPSLSDPSAWLGAIIPAAPALASVRKRAILRSVTVSRSFGSMLPNALAKTWASPTTTVGLLLGTLGLALGGTRPRIGNNAIEFCGNRLIAPFTSAVTFGHAILYASREPDARVRLHELQHTYQAELLGPLYLPLHIGFQLAAFAYSFFDRSRCYTCVNDRVHSRANLLETGPMATTPRPWPSPLNARAAGESRGTAARPKRS